MSLFSLNADVLSLILAHLTPQDARQLLTTSHAGYDIAMPYFLRQVAFDEWPTRPTRIEPAERIRMFCEFMLADAERRIPCLRVLQLHGHAFALRSTRVQAGQTVWVRAYSCPCHFSRVLRLATGLRELRLLYADELLAVADRDCLFDALVALPAIDVMHLDDYPLACELLSKTMSRPRTLYLYAGRGTRPHTSGTFLGKHLPENLGECLEDLHFRGSVILAKNLHRAGIVFPRLRKLGMRFGYCASLASIAAAFPNLRALEIVRVAFALDQPPAVWKSGLDRVQLDKDLTEGVIPLACKIRQLELLTPVSHPRMQPSFATLLSSSSPTVLFLSIAHDETGSWMAEVVRVAPGLEYLHLVLRSLDETLVVSTRVSYMGTRMLRHVVNAPD